MGPAGERRSGNFEQLSSEISEYFRDGRREMHIVLDADPTPARTVNPRLDSYHRARSKRGLDGLRQTGRFVHLEAQSVTQAVTECVSIATVLNVARSETIGILALHSRAYGFRRDGVGVAHDVVDRALLVRRLADHHR